MYKRIHSGCLILLAFCLIVLSSVNISGGSKVNAADLKIKMNGIPMTYQGKAVYITLDGKAINMNQTPGIVNGGVSYVSYQDVFTKSKLKSKSSYNKKTKQITITRKDQTIVMILGDKTAVVNGVKQKMNGAPMQVTFPNKKTKILVPTEFVARAIGCDYQWKSDQSKVYVQLKTPREYTEDGTSHVISGQAEQIFVDNRKLNLTAAPCIRFEGVLYVCAQTVFESSDLCCDFSFDAEKLTCELSNDDTDLQMTIGQKEAKKDEDDVTLSAAPRIIKLQQNKKNQVYLPVQEVCELLGYRYQRNNGNAVSYITSVAQDSSVPSQDENGDNTDEDDGDDEPTKEEPSKDDQNKQEITGEKEYQFEINLPQKISNNQISDSDCYLNKQIKLYLPGNCTVELEKAKESCNNPYISDISAQVVGDKTEMIIKTTRVCGYRYNVKEKKLTIEVNRPNKIYRKIVLLDPGHGGSASPGCTNKGYQERNITYTILHDITEELMKDTGIKVYYTRLGDYFVGLHQRGIYAEDVDADLFVSLHLNSVGKKDPIPHGTEVYYYNNASMNGLTSKKMAEYFCNNLVKAMNTKSRGAKKHGWTVIATAKCPAVLIELGFLTNTVPAVAGEPADFDKVTSSEYQQIAAETIRDTLVAIMEEYPTGR